MLKKDTRRQLKEHGWLEIAKKHSNPYLALNRLRDQGIEAINDLCLFAKKLPTNTLNDIFSDYNVARLAAAILRENEHPNTEDDARRIQLAARLVEIGIDRCVRLYERKIEQNSVLSEPIISQLTKAQDICNEISFKMRIPKIKAAAEKEDLLYLFNWGRISDVYEKKVSEIEGEDTKKFIKYCDWEFYESTGPRFIEIVHRISQISDNDTGFEFTDMYGNRFGGQMTISREEKKGYLVLRDAGKTILKRTFVVKIELDDIYVYKKKKDALL
jgi:hypothetical protein